MVSRPMELFTFLFYHSSCPRVGAVALMLTPVPGLARNEYGEDVNALVSIESAYN
jgi:hypothetical protein